MSHSLLKEYISLLIEVGNPRVGNQLLSPAGKKGGSSKKKKGTSGKKKSDTKVSEFSAAGGGAIVGHMGGDSPGPKKEWS
jgi:hypothetical protein